MLNYFGAPEFSTPEMLVIPAKKVNGNNISAGTELIVSLSSDFCYKTSDNYYVTVGSPTKWNYFVNSDTDSAPPTLSIDFKTVESHLTTRDGTLKVDGTNKIKPNWLNVRSDIVPSETLDNPVSRNPSAYFAKDGKIYLNISSSDYGSGPSSLKMEIFDVYNTSKKYSDFAKVEPGVPRITNNTNLVTLVLRSSGNSGIFNTVLAQGDEYYDDAGNKKVNDTADKPVSKEYDLNVVDGTYRIRFIADDNNGNTAYSKYYFVYVDSENAQVKTPVVSNLTENSMKFTLVEPTGYTFIERYDFDNDKYRDPEIVSDSILLQGLTAGTKYKYKLYSTDEFGNRNNYIEFEKNTLPKKLVLSPLQESSDREILVKWNKPAGNYASAIVYYKLHEETSFRSVQIPAQSSDVQSFIIRELIPGGAYDVKIKSNDEGDSFSVNYSEDSALGQINLKPAAVTGINAIAADSEGTVKLTWEEPEGFFDKYLITPKKGDTSSSPVEVERTKLEKEITGLTPGDLYEFSIKTRRVVKGISKDGNEDSFIDSSDIKTSVTVKPQNISSVSTTKTTSSITVKWTKPSSTYDGIMLGYKKEGTAQYEYTTVEKNLSSYTLNELDAGSTYDISYYTYSGETNSVVNSGTQVTTVPNPVSNPVGRAKDGDSNKLILSWDAPEGVYTKIKIEQSENNEGAFSTVEEVTGRTSSVELPVRAGSTYFYKITVYSGDDNESIPVSCKANTGVNSVENVSIKANTSTSVTLGWSRPSGNYNGVNIYWKLTSEPSYPSEPQFTATNTDTEKEITGLEAGARYDFKLETYVIKESTITADTTVTGNTRPNNATTVVLTATGSNGLKFTWKKPSSGSWTGYFLFYNTENNLSSATYLALANDSTTETLTRSFTSSSSKPINAGTKYYGWVIPYSGSIASREYDLIKAGTSLVNANSNSSSNCTTNPGAPTNLVANFSFSTSKVTLTWKKPSIGSTVGYKVEYKDKSKSDTNYSELPGSIEYKASDLTYNVVSTEPLPKGHLYEFRVTSYIGTAVDPVYGNSTTVSTYNYPAYISDVLVTPGDENGENRTTALEVSWENPEADTFAGVVVFCGSQKKVIQAPNNSCVFTGLSIGSAPTISWATYSGAYVDGWAYDEYYYHSNTGSADYEDGMCTTTGYTAPGPITGLSVTATTKQSVTLKWSAPTSGSHSGFAIYKKLVGASQYDNNPIYTSSSSYEVTGLEVGKQYEFAVYAYNGYKSIQSINAVTVQQYTRPNDEPVSIVQDANNPATKAKISWNLNTNRGIYIFKNTTNNFDTASYVTWYHATESTKSISTACETSATTYYWIVTWAGAINDRPTNTPAACKAALNTTVSDPIIHYAKPGNASSLTVTSKTTNSVTLSWTAPSTVGGTAYKITKKDITANGSEIDVISGGGTTATSYKISSLEAGHKYTFTVTPWVGTRTNCSDTLTVTNVYTIPPVVPSSNFTVTRISSDQSNNKTKMTVKWTEYPVKRSDSWIYIYKNTTNNFSTATYVDWWGYGDYSSTSSASYSVDNTTGYYWWIATVVATSQPDNTDISTGAALNSYTANNAAVNVSSVKGIVYTAPNKATGISVYMDNGQGRIQVKWTNPVSPDMTGALVEVYDSTTRKAYEYKSCSSNTISYSSFLDISGFSRQKTYSIKVTPYIYSNSTYLFGGEQTYSYSNSSGNMKIKGNSYSYTALRNVITSSKTIQQVSGSSSYTGGAFPNGRSVTLSPYSIGQYEVTNDFYAAVMGTSSYPGSGGSWDQPAEGFNFYRAAVFCNKLSSLFGFTPFYNIGGKDSTYDWNNYTNIDGIPTTSSSYWNVFTINTNSNGYRLPSEPQWEFAARGGVQNGTQWAYKFSGSDTYTNVAWFKNNSGGAKHSVGRKNSNALGLYDMSGNVYEWLSDYNYDPTSSNGGNDPYFTYDKKKETKILYKGAGFATSDTSKWPIDYNSEKIEPWNSAGDVGMRICRNATCTQ